MIILSSRQATAIAEMAAAKYENIFYRFYWEQFNNKEFKKVNKKEFNNLGQSCAKIS